LRTPTCSGSSLRGMYSWWFSLISQIDQILEVVPGYHFPDVLTSHTVPAPFQCENPQLVWRRASF
jgi:hypothetical protein